MMARLPGGRWTLVLVLISVVACSRSSSGRKPPVFELKSAAYADTNLNGVVDPGDTVTVTFDEGVQAPGSPAADGVFAIVPSGTFGTGATVDPVSLTDFEIILGPGASLQPNGVYGVDPNATGLNVAPFQTGLTDPTGAPLAPLGVPVDLEGAAPPAIATVRLTDFNGNCRLDAGDSLDVVFASNVSVTTADPAQAFVLPVVGDSLGTGAQFAGGGMPTDVGTVTIVLGAGFVLQPTGLYSSSVVTAGSPSGVDVTASPGVVVDAAAPAVSAIQKVPVGEDIPEAGIQNLLWESQGDDQPGAEFGIFVASAGDINNDGYDDVVVGAPDFTTAGGAEGKAYVFLGSPTGLDTVPSWTSSGDDQRGAAFGSSVASAGDIDNDGYDDVIVGAEAFDATNVNAGKAYLYRGGPTGLSTTASWTSSGDDAGADRFGVKVDSAGDVNNDGFDDVVVSASHFASTSSFVGKVFVYRGGAGGLATTPSWTSIGEDQMQANFGFGCAGAGDVNGDGYGDIIIGAPGYDSPNSNAGKAYVFQGGPTGLGTIAAWTSLGDDVGGSQVGYDVNAAGDVNDDGHDDVIIGANIYGGMIGKAWLYLGSASGLATTANWASTGDSQSGAWYGTKVACAGDVNGDGADDIIVGAFSYDTLNQDAGKAYVYLGGATGPATTPIWTSSGDDQPDGWFGIGVASGGDVDGNGFPEVLVGAGRFDGSGTNSGKAYLYCVRP